MDRTLRAVAVGYASIDHKYLVDKFHGTGRTTLAAPAGSGELAAGAASYFARAMAGDGVQAAIVSWVANDHPGRVFRRVLLDARIDVTGISVTGSRSPVAFMFYDRDGDSMTFFDGGDVDTSVTPEQRGVIERADAVLIGIGPAAATAEICAACRDDAYVLWAVKADPGSVTPALAASLAHRANAVSLNKSEKSFVEDSCGRALEELAAHGTTVIVTDGSRGVDWFVGGERGEWRGTPVTAVTDATGAGDTFAGSLMTNLARGFHASGDPRDITTAVDAASEAAAELLRLRQNTRSI